MRFFGIVDDFLSKKGLQEKLKSKRADLFIHGDDTILTDAFGINKFFVLIQLFESQVLHSINWRITVRDLNRLGLSRCSA